MKHSFPSHIVRVFLSSNSRMSMTEDHAMRKHVMIYMNKFCADQPAHSSRLIST